ncbi:MAG: protein phosphatase 2C domain-containing protein [Proteobacteria bacterium]|nr:protein phosphatase 2C domain-containing protein [Pseudomonadota bacterium]
MPAQLPEKASQVPCPADGDSIIFARDLDAWLAKTKLAIQCTGGIGESRFAVLEESSDTLVFVLQSENESSLKLVTSLPGFDSTFLWQAEDSEQKPWTVFVHFPVSTKLPMPRSCADFFMAPICSGHLADAFVQAYDLSEIVTLRSYRESAGQISPNVIFLILDRIATQLQRLFQTGHTLFRLCPDNIVLMHDAVLFIGLDALDLPWNERCAVAHHQTDFATVPPEYFGFMRQRMEPRQGVYVIGALAYFLVAGERVPTCEAIGYDVAIEPRAFNPIFPIGWDEIIHKALQPNPDLRFPNIAVFMNALQDALNVMMERFSSRVPLCYDASVDTHIGITKKLRCPINQDAVFLQMTADMRRMLIVVADGVSTSTYGSGDIASHMLTDVAGEFWTDHIEHIEDLNAVSEIQKILNTANDRISQYILDRYADLSPASSECMGSTALVAIIDNGVLTLGSIGDSRAYIIRDDSMSCITRDHNLFTIGIINGLPVEMCASHPHAGSLVQCLGYSDATEDSELAFDIFSMHLIPGDTFMMTTDGILDYIACDINESEKLIAELVRCGHCSGITCLELILQANLGGGGDNCGVAIVRVNELAES